MCNHVFGNFVIVICWSIDACNGDCDFSLELKVYLHDSSSIVFSFEFVFSDYFFFKYYSYARALGVKRIMSLAVYIFFIFFIEIEICFDKI
jgi:hypothetical protein